MAPERISEVYLDNAASTALDPAVATAMAPFLQRRPGNASAVHRPGVLAARGVERARAIVARRLNVQASRIFFTSGGTESNNLAIQGVARALAERRGRHLVSSRVEHSSVSEPLRWLERQGFELSWLEVDSSGRVCPAAVARALRPDTALLSLIHGNNEIGTLQPVAAIGALCRQAGVLFHVDACQSFTREPMDLRALPIDLLSVNAHKLHGPKGVGALYVRSGVELEPLCHGGGQEQGLRPGTLNTPGIVGFGEAVLQAQPEQNQAVRAQRDWFAERLLHSVPDAQINGHPTEHLCHVLSATLPSIDGKTLFLELNRRGIHASLGSACSSAATTPSHVLSAIGLSPQQARRTLRFSLSRWTTRAHMQYVLDNILEILQSSEDLI